ncbi:MAG: hypothetical protein KJN62_06300 [Deltaproteobacteria bacterium]|nr:hypothetical protein [Deltaproteobacteria bacterium]
MDRITNLQDRRFGQHAMLPGGRGTGMSRVNLSSLSSHEIASSAEADSQ